MPSPCSSLSHLLLSSLLIMPLLAPSLLQAGKPIPPDMQSIYDVTDEQGERLTDSFPPTTRLTFLPNDTFVAAVHDEETSVCHVFQFKAHTGRWQRTRVEAIHLLLPPASPENFDEDGEEFVPATPRTPAEEMEDEEEVKAAAEGDGHEAALAAQAAPHAGPVWPVDDSESVDFGNPERAPSPAIEEVTYTVTPSGAPIFHHTAPAFIAYAGLIFQRTVGNRPSTPLAKLDRYVVNAAICPEQKWVACLKTNGDLLLWNPHHADTRVPQPQRRQEHHS